MSTEKWPFDQPPDCAVVTLRTIVFEGAPILLVSHSADDHGWQFLSGGEFSMANAALVRLGNIVKRDPSVLELADMPPGWTAQRESASSPWVRSPD